MAFYSRAPIESLTFSPDENLLIASTLNDSNNVEFWDVASGSLIFSLDAHPGATRRTWISPDSRLLVTAGMAKDYSIRLWTLEGAQILETLGDAEISDTGESTPSGTEMPAIPVGLTACNIAVGNVVTVSPLITVMDLREDPRINCESGYVTTCFSTTKDVANFAASDMTTFRQGTPLIVVGGPNLGPVSNGYEGYWWEVKDAAGAYSGWIRQELIYGCEPGSSLTPGIPPELNRRDAMDCYSRKEHTNIECDVGFRTYPIEIRVTDEGFAPDSLTASMNHPVVLRNVTNHIVTLERIKPDYTDVIPDMLTLQPGEIFTFSPQTTEMHIFRDNSTYERTTIAIGGPVKTSPGTSD